MFYSDEQRASCDASSLFALLHFVQLKVHRACVCACARSSMYTRIPSDAQINISILWHTAETRKLTLVRIVLKCKVLFLHASSGTTPSCLFSHAVSNCCVQRYLLYWHHHRSRCFVVLHACFGKDTVLVDKDQKGWLCQSYRLTNDLFFGSPYQNILYCEQKYERRRQAELIWTSQVENR